MKDLTHPPSEFRSCAADFRLHYSWPKALANTAMPCRGCIDPLHPLTGAPLTKRELYGVDSDYPVHYTIYGKNAWDVWDKREAAAAHLSTLMAERDLLANTTARADDSVKAFSLSVLARDFKDEFFSLHSNHWKERTVTEYLRQYDILTTELEGFCVGDLNNATYQHIQTKICLHALENARKMDTWKYGDEPPASARKRMSLLFELIQDLKQVEGVPIPAIPTRYNSMPSRQQQLLDRIDSARSLPSAPLCSAATQPLFQGQPGIMLDAGLRISEVAGLLFGCIRSVQTSQGTLYCVDINGQLSPSGKRSEITKTDSSYRVVPLSSELALELVNYREKLEQRYGDLSLRLCCGRCNADEFDDSPSVAAAWQDQVSKQVPQLLREPAFFQALAAARIFCFDEKAQDASLYAMLTSHSLRRNFCTRLYCFSGLGTDEIYRQMGHAQKNAPRRTATGLTPAELRRMCLQQYVSHTPYHHANPLQYAVDGPIQASEVPACTIKLVLQPGESISLTVADTEPGTVTRITGEGLHIECPRRAECRDITSYSYGLLPSETTVTILKKFKLFE